MVLFTSVRLDVVKQMHSRNLESDKTAISKKKKKIADRDLTSRNLFLKTIIWRHKRRK